MQEVEILSYTTPTELNNTTPTSQLPDKISLIVQSTSPFSPEVISIPQILCETYAEIFNMDINYTNSFTLDNSKIISSLPYAIYGANIIKKYNLNYFLKKLTKLENLNIPNTSNSEYIHIKFQEIEKLILTDLQLILSVYNYLKYYKRSGTFSAYLKQFFELFYNTRDSLRTIRNDKKILREFLEVYHVNKEDQVRIFSVMYRF
jgi:hypothetical protein